METEFPSQKFREIVFQFVFALDFGGNEQDELIPFLMRELAVSKRHVRAAHEKALAVWAHHASLDRLIEEKSLAYSFDRIKSVEKNVLRLTLYELLIEKELNAKILISEAIRLTRKFAAAEGASYVNAVLDSLATIEEKSEAPLSAPQEPVTQ